MVNKKIGVKFSLVLSSTTQTCKCEHLPNSCLPCGLGSTCQIMYCRTQRAYHKCIFYFVTPLMCTENGGVSAYYTGINEGPATTRRTNKKSGTHKTCFSLTVMKTHGCKNYFPQKNCHHWLITQVTNSRLPFAEQAKHLYQQAPRLVYTSGDFVQHFTCPLKGQ